MVKRLRWKRLQLARESIECAPGRWPWSRRLARRDSYWPYVMTNCTSTPDLRSRSSTMTSRVWCFTPGRVSNGSHGHTGAESRFSDV